MPYVIGRRDLSSKRLADLHSGLVKAIPRIPNNRASLQLLKAKGLGEVLIYFLSWRSRYVAPRPRKVSIDSAIWADTRSIANKDAIAAFLTRVAAGEDLTPWLSLQPHNRGFAVSATLPGPNADKWADKDFLLNVMGMHHFHLGRSIEPQGHAVRTNEVIFAEVTRETFEVVALADHGVFEDGDDGQLTAEREELWTLHEARRARNMVPGAVYIGGGLGGLGIATSGHPTAIVLSAQRYAQIIRDTDPKLDDPVFVEALYPTGSPPRTPKLSWRFNHLDLTLVDEANECFFTMRRGPN